MRRRPLPALVPLAALVFALSTLAPVGVYPATTVNTSHIWTWGAHVPHEHSATSGSAFDLERVVLDGSSDDPLLTFTFTLRSLPKPEQAAMASITFRNASGTRAGYLLIRWPGHGERPVVSEIDTIAKRGRLLDLEPVVDRRARTITARYPRDVFEFGEGFWYWHADTYVGRKHVDNGAAHPYPLERTGVDPRIVRGADWTAPYPVPMLAREQ